MKIFSIIELFKVQMYQTFNKIEIECHETFALKLHQHPFGITFIENPERINSFFTTSYVFYKVKNNTLNENYNFALLKKHYDSTLY